MDFFMEKLKDIWEKPLSFCGRTLDGSGRNPAAPGFSPPAAPGLPFPPEEAEGHFRRLSQEGVSFVRLVIAWESLEHAGPGLYDEACLGKLRKILVAAAHAEISLFIDPVQNRWSRWISGEGAPSWAPERRDEGGEWLQERYFDCMRHCFRRLKNCDALIGWGASGEDCSRPFLLRFAERMREAREGIRFFMAETAQGEGALRLGTGDDPDWAAGAFYYYDGSAFPDYRRDAAINVSC
jgi:hypothetical protein